MMGVNGFAGRDFMSQKNGSRRFLVPGAISCLFRSSQRFNSSYHIADWQVEALDHAPAGFA